MSLKLTLFKNTAFNLTGYLYLLLVSFFSISIFLNNLGRDLFGVYLFLASFVPMASVFDFGVSVATIRELSLTKNSDEEKVRVWQTALTIFIAQALLLIVIFSGVLLYLFFHLPLLQNFDQSLILPLVMVISLTIFVNHLNNIFLSVPQALQRFDIYNSKTFLVGTANTILSALLTFVTHDLRHLFLLQLLFHLFTSVYIIWYTQNVFKWKNIFPKYYPETGKKIMNYGLKNFVGTLAGQVEAQVSKFFLGFLSTAQAITAFSIPQNITMKAAGVVSQLAQAFFPLSASLLEKDRIFKLRRLFLALQVLILFGGFLAVLLVFNFGEGFLTWWLHDQVIVIAAYPVLKVMSFYFILVALTPLPTALIQGLGKPQVASFFAVLTITLEIIFLSVFIPNYHELGAAYSFLCSSAIAVPLFLLFTYYSLNQKIDEYK